MLGLVYVRKRGGNVNIFLLLNSTRTHYIFSFKLGRKWGEEMTLSWKLLIHFYIISMLVNYSSSFYFPSFMPTTYCENHKSFLLHNIFHPSNQASPLTYFPSHITKANKHGQMHKLRSCIASPIPPHQCKPQHNHIEHTLTSKYSYTQIYLTQSPNQSITLFNHKRKPFLNRPIQQTKIQIQTLKPIPNPSTRFVIFHSKLKPLNFKRAHIPILHCCDITPTAIVDFNYCRS